MDTLSPQERESLQSELSDWSLDGEVLRRTFEFEDFVAALGFVMRVGILSEKANHHPDIDVRWNKVSLALSTHDAGGLTARDTALARKIDALD